MTVSIAHQGFSFRNYWGVLNADFTHEGEKKGKGEKPGRAETHRGDGGDGGDGDGSGLRFGLNVCV